MEGGLRPISWMIKPVSGRCQMRCRYCFYADEVASRGPRECQELSMELAEQMIQKTLERSEHHVSFAFQGGEPTLWGLERYQAFVHLVEKWNHQKLPVHYALQTNGLMLDQEWALFLKKHRFLVGLSLDGPRSLHDKNRRDSKGEGTFTRALEGAQLLLQQGVPFNILSVLTEENAAQIGRIYRFLISQGFYYQQYIPCLDALAGEASADSLTPGTYGEALKELYALYREDRRRGLPVSIRFFDNLIAMMEGREPEACDMRGHCSVQYVLEADGGVYPCDFFVLDPYCLGRIDTNSFDELDQKRRELRFIENSLQRPEKCGSCAYVSLCRGGCRRYRKGDFLNPESPLGEMRFCESYQSFFKYLV